MHLLGIDPGKSGYMCLLDTNTSQIKLYSLALESLTKDYFNELKSMVDFALIERVHAFPHQGVVSQFTFGYHYGLLIGFLLAHNIPFEDVLPTKWQKYYSVPKLDKAARKEWLWNRAKELYPNAAIPKGAGDSVLIAHFLSRYYKLEEAI